MYNIDPSLMEPLDFSKAEEEKKKKWLGGLLSADPDDPHSQGLLGMAAAMLQASGPSRMPTTFGQNLGKGLQGYQQGRAQGIEQQNQNTMLDLKKQALARGPAGPNMQDESAIKRYLFRQSLTSDADRKIFDDMIRSQQFLNLGDRFAGIGVGGNVSSTLPINLKPGERPEVRAAQSGAVEREKHQVDLEKARPKIEAALEGAFSKDDLLDKSIDDAMNMAGWNTTGFIGQKFSGIGGTEAHDLQQTLATIKANVGFDRLQEMRANSPTGGALGSVSENENRLLQSVWGSVEQSQSADQLKRNLERLRKQKKESWARIMDAYEKDYGTRYSPKAAAAPAGGSSGNRTIDDILKKY